MRSNRTALLATTLAFAWSLPAVAVTDWSKVDAVLAKKAAVSGMVHRYGLPRSDLHVTLDGVIIKPGLALGGVGGVHADGQQHYADGRSRAD